MAADRVSWSVIVHGGAKSIAPADEAADRSGCLAAIQAARKVLTADGSAVDAAEAAMRMLERDATFNAGAGAARDADGHATLDAALMDGSTLTIGAVAALQGFAHPISVARLLLTEAAVLLVGEGAARFASERGAEPLLLNEADGARSQALCLAHDTVGCVVRDRRGHFAVGVSTGGLEGARPGRVGDSPMPGCGFYADDTIGATALTGDGESIARTMLAARIMEALEQSADPAAAVAGALKRLQRVGGEAGGIALDRHGRAGFAHTSSHMPVAWQREGMPEPEARLSQEDLQ